jgi:hypothetical protein
MKTLFGILLAALALPAFASIWATAGVKTNPANGTILADTGAISGGVGSYTIVVASTVVARLEVVVRDAANTTDVNMQTLPTVASGLVHLMLPMDVPPGGRIVIRNNGAITGVVHASILSE